MRRPDPVPPAGSWQRLRGRAAAPVAPPIERDLPQIADDKTLKVLFTFNTTGYFIYRGEPMGYEYELLSRFASESKLRLKPIVARDTRHLSLSNEPVCKYGFARGAEPVGYVDTILGRWEHYREFVTDEPESSASLGGGR